MVNTTNCKHSIESLDFQLQYVTNKNYYHFDIAQKSSFIYQKKTKFQVKKREI